LFAVAHLTGNHLLAKLPQKIGNSRVSIFEPLLPQFAQLRQMRRFAIGLQFQKPHQLPFHP
jgi:hypothetical protein